MFTIKANLLYTGKMLKTDAYISVDKTIISDIGTEGSKVLKEYPVITPAFIDPHCHIGLMRFGEPSTEAEGNEKCDSILIFADILDSIQMDDHAFQKAIQAGVLYSCVLPGSNNILSGRAAIIRNYGETTTSALIARAGIKAALGFNTIVCDEWKGKRPTTRMGALAILREKLFTMVEKLKSTTTSTLTKEEEIYENILMGKEKLRVHAHKADDIESILRLVDEIHSIHKKYTIKLSIEHAGNIHTPYIFTMLKKRNIPVVYGPLDAFPYKVELKHMNWKNISHLLDSKVDFGLMTDHPVVLQTSFLYQLRLFTRLGLNKEQAIRIITYQNAKILGIDTILGTLEKRKWASFICWNGDPFDMTKYPVAVYGEGKLLYSEKQAETGNCDN